MFTIRRIHTMMLCYVMVFECGYSDGMSLRRSCGAELSKRIATVCEELGGYNAPQKGVGHHRVRRRVADECCKKICDDAVISLYCSNTSEKVPRAVEEVPEPYDIYEPSDKFLETPSSTPRNKKISTMIYPQFKIGTVAPEFTKIAITPPLSRIYQYKF